MSQGTKGKKALDVLRSPREIINLKKRGERFVVADLNIPRKLFMNKLKRGILFCFFGAEATAGNRRIV
jgi:hypothetical protein